MSQEMPKRYELSVPTLKAVRDLGGSASNAEILKKVIENEQYPPSITEVLRGDSNKTELEYQVAWARSVLKFTGYLDNTSRGVWALTKKGREADAVDIDEIIAIERGIHRSRRREAEKPVVNGDDYEDAEEIEDDSESWRDQLHRTLLNLEPDAFERLCQRLLRESGFIEVVVTGRSGDGGIDGNGVIRISGLISFTVIFQAKRYAGSVGAGVVRDFRGAMVGRADKGLIITTGHFTVDAQREAIRDGAPPIDLIDGELLADKLKELGLGVRTQMVEQVEVDEEWFAEV